MYQKINRLFLFFRGGKLVDKCVKTYQPDNFLIIRLVNITK